MTEQLASPSENFVKFFINEVSPGKLSPAAREQFAHATQRALGSFINDQINRRLKTSLGAETRISPDEAQPPVKAEAAEAKPEEGERVSTTSDEMEAYFIVKAIS